MTRGTVLICDGEFLELFHTLLKTISAHCNLSSKNKCKEPHLNKIATGDIIALWVFIQWLMRVQPPEGSFHCHLIANCRWVPSPDYLISVQVLMNTSFFWPFFMRCQLFFIVGILPCDFDSSLAIYCSFSR